MSGAGWNWYRFRNHIYVHLVFPESTCPQENEHSPETVKRTPKSSNNKPSKMIAETRAKKKQKNDCTAKKYTIPSKTSKPRIIFEIHDRIKFPWIECFYTLVRIWKLIPEAIVLTIKRWELYIPYWKHKISDFYLEFQFFSSFSFCLQ